MRVEYSPMDSSAGGAAGLLSLLSPYAIEVGGNSGSSSTTLESPVYSPAAGSFTSDQSISISANASGATIHYTTDGSDPTTNSSVYSNPISVSGDGTSLTIKAMAVQSGMNNSPVVSGTYTISYSSSTATSTSASGSVPGAPTGLSATGASTTVTLSWSSVSGATSYNLYRGTSTGVTTSTGTKIAGVTSSYTDTGLTNGTHYYYIVTAVNATGEGTASSEASAMPYLSYVPLKTLQTTCWNASGTVISCSGTGHDGEYQAGRVINFTGPTQHATYTSDYTTTDSGTGLVWKSCIEGKSGSDCSTGSTTTADLTTATSSCTALNSSNSGAGYAGRTNWRIPTIEEFETIINYSTVVPSSFATYFPATPQTVYWSSTDYGADTTKAYYANYYHGFVGPDTKTNLKAIRCVSPGSSYTVPTPAFTDNGDGTVTDSTSGLVWQKCSMGQTNDSTCSGTATQPDWDTALSYCNTLTLAGKSWRLPNVNELRTILDRSLATGPLINSTYFPGTVNDWYWSSSTSLDTLSEAWHARFTNGTMWTSIKTSEPEYVRCVSGGL